MYWFYFWRIDIFGVQDYINFTFVKLFKLSLLLALSNSNIVNKAHSQTFWSHLVTVSVSQNVFFSRVRPKLSKRCSPSSRRITTKFTWTCLDEEPEFSLSEFETWERFRIKTFGIWNGNLLRLNSGEKSEALYDDNFRFVMITKFNQNCRKRVITRTQKSIMECSFF